MVGGGGWREQTASVALGQAISLQLALLSVVTKLVADWHTEPLPGLQNLLGYVALFAVSAHRLKADGLHLWQQWNIKTSSIVSLLVISTLDSFGAFLTNLSFHYKISLASMTLLGSFTIPCAMALSFVCLGARYGATHLAGIGLAMGGLFCVLQADWVQQQPEEVPLTATVLGFNPDWLVLLAAVLYAVSNVLSEVYLQETLQLSLYLSWLSLFGGVVSVVQVYGNGEQVSLIPAAVWGLLVVHTALFVACFWSIALFFTKYDAVGLNLNLLTSGLFGMIFASKVFHERVLAIKIAGYWLLVGGIVWYSRYPAKTWREAGYEEL